MAFILLTSILVSSAHASTNVEHQRIFFDLSGEGFFGLLNDGPSGFSKMVDDLESLDYVVEDNFISNANIGFISENELRNSDIYIITNPKRDFTPKEKTALYNYVKNGGSLIVICDSISSINSTNHLLKQFNMAFKKEAVLNPEIFFKNTSVSFDYAIPIKDVEIERYKEIDSEGSEELFNINYSKLNASTGTTYENSTLFKAKKVSNGRIVVLGTKDFLKNDRYQQNKELWHYMLSEHVNILDPSYIIFDPFEIKIPINNPDFFNTTFNIAYEINSLNESTGSEQLIKKVNISFEVNPPSTSGKASIIKNLSEDTYDEN